MREHGRLVDALKDVGTVVFALLIAATMICAGLAAMSPIRDLRIFFGALLLATNWVAAVVVINIASNWQATSSIFFLDILCAFGFYRLANPTDSPDTIESHSKHIPDPPSGIRGYFHEHWASYGFADYTLIIFLSMSNFLARHEGPFRLPLISILIFLALLVAIGFLRGFGLARGMLFVAICTALVVSSLYAYVQVVNFLTLAVILLFLHRAAHNAIGNICFWISK